MKKLARSCFLLLALIAGFVRAEDLKLGATAPDWKDLKGTDDKLYSLADFKDNEVLVIVFTCNSCPYAQDYEDRTIALVKSHCGEGKKTALIAINANKVKEDLPEEMKKRAKEKGFNYPYVWDETQATAKAYGARWTPEFFVFDRDRKLVYRGAMDDDTDPKNAKVNYVAAAIGAALAGEKPKVQEMPAKGCAIRYERPKRK
jgi:peroxiredoxin